MGQPFSVNITRFDPYKSYRFLVYFGTSTTPVAGVSKVTAGKRKSEPIMYKEGGNMLIRQGLGRTEYEPVTLERGVTHDADFETWANAAQLLDKGAPSTSLKNLRQEVRIVILNEAGQPVQAFNFHRAWVTEYQAFGDLDGGSNAILIEMLRFVHEGWERDTSVTEPTEV